MLEIRVSQPPADGAANEAILRLLSKALGISRAELKIVAGATSRHKRIAIPFDLDEALRRLGAIGK